MTQHAAPAPGPAEPAASEGRSEAPEGRSEAPEPSYAERARTLLHLARAGTLSTVSRRREGHPFGSLMPFALDGQGRPLFLISDMAVHTQNLHTDARASLFVTQPGWTGDPLAAGRVTVMGEVRRMPDADVAPARAVYLARHERASAWVDFGDFGFYRLEVQDIYFVGGFAAMGWIEGDDYRAAQPDPLGEVAGSIMEHMNGDHADALVKYARGLARVAADEATMIAVDRLGFRLRVKSGERLHAVRIAFPREVRTTADARTVLIEMLRKLPEDIR